MRLSIISFTKNGIQLSGKIAFKIDDNIECKLYTKCSVYNLNDKIKDETKNVHLEYVENSISEWAKEQFDRKNALIFIGACGIAVRAIAPHITDKLHDSPVIVVDEKGQYVIPILSGHVGGANELSKNIAKILGATPVITTATDINNKFSVDMFAKKNGLLITNKSGIAKVSSKVLSGEKVTISIETGHYDDKINLPEEIELIEYPPIGFADIVITSENNKFDCSLLLTPQKFIIGMGCKRGKEIEKIDSFIKNNLENAGISINQVSGLATIDLKKDEKGLTTWCSNEKKDFITYTTEELNSVQGDFTKSEFVSATVGVDNVCERAALRASGNGGRLVYEKRAYDGMTIAIAATRDIKKWSVNFDEE
jgi:cobalt-precorrin 5A hydrolase